MSNIPRILVLFGNVPLLGQERANIDALDALHEAGCEVLFLIRGEWTQNSIQPELNRRNLTFLAVPYFDAVRYGVSFRIWWNNIKGILGGSWQLLKQIRIFHATHIHAGSMANILNFIPALMITRLPLVFRAGDVPSQHHALWRWIWKYTCQRASHFVCDSYFIQNRLIEMGAKPEKCSVLYAPAPQRSFEVENADLLPPKIPNQLYVVYVGQISEAKGVHLLVEAAQQLCQVRNDICFLIAGDYEWNNPLGRSLVELVIESDMQNRIVFTGFVNNIDNLYNLADVHICPSLCEEAYGLTVVEAKERGVPSIVFASGGLLELIDDGIDGTVCKDKTSSEISNAILAYLDDRLLLSRHGEAACHSLQRLHINKYAQHWQEIYNNVSS